MRIQSPGTCVRATGSLKNIHVFVATSYAIDLGSSMTQREWTPGVAVENLK